jgi:hypothetical protein
MTLIPFSASPAALVHDLLKFEYHDCFFSTDYIGDAKKRPTYYNEVVFANIIGWRI